MIHCGGSTMGTRRFASTIGKRSLPLVNRGNFTTSPTIEMSQQTCLSQAADKLESLVNQWQRQLDSFVKLASEDIPPQKTNKAKPAIKPAQRDAMPKRRQVLLGGETFRLKDRHAFIMEPETQTGNNVDKPWIFYAPTLSAYPDKAESWMHQQFLDAGIAVAGIDVGEAYGSPKAFPFFEALYDEMANRGYSKTPAMLGRSRGGLWVSSWAVQAP